MGHIITKAAHELNYYFPLRIQIIAAANLNLHAENNINNPVGKATFFSVLIIMCRGGSGVGGGGADPFL